MRDNPKLTVFCVTYNQAAYIRQTLDSFLMQQTDFEFEIVIGDDGSNDGTTDICREYAAAHPDKIRHFIRDRRISLTYKYLAQYNVIETCKACRGKYISVCEGDDYWEHPYVLQKQVDFLDAHPDYGIVHGGVSYYFEEGKQLSRYVKGRPHIPQGDLYQELFSGNYIKNCSICMRIEVLRILQYMIENVAKWPTSDHMYWMEACAQGYKIGYVDEPFSIYRVHRQSTMNTEDIRKELKNIQSKFKIRCYFLHKYGSPYSHDELLLFYLRNARQVALNYGKTELACRYERFLNKVMQKIHADNGAMFQTDDAVWF